MNTIDGALLEPVVGTEASQHRAERPKKRGPLPRLHLLAAIVAILASVTLLVHSAYLAWGMGDDAILARIVATAKVERDDRVNSPDARLAKPGSLALPSDVRIDERIGDPDVRRSVLASFEQQRARGIAPLIRVALAGLLAMFAFLLLARATDIVRFAGFAVGVMTALPTIGVVGVGMYSSRISAYFVDLGVGLEVALAALLPMAVIACFAVAASRRTVVGGVDFEEAR